MTIVVWVGARRDRPGVPGERIPGRMGVLMTASGPQGKQIIETPPGRMIVNHHLLRHQLAELSNRRRCIAVDLVGYGHTETADDQDVSFEVQARRPAAPRRPRPGTGR